MDRFTIVELPGVGARESFAEAVRAGLSRRPKGLPPRFFYDDRGSPLFEKICELPEYYLTRTEAAILERHAAEAAHGDFGAVVELGSGSATKTRLLLDALARAGRPLTYVPIDISRSSLEGCAPPLLATFPRLSVRAYLAEYDHSLDVISRHESAPALVLFLGSNIGNCDMTEALALLTKLRRALTRRESRVLVGLDRQKDEQVLHAAYNDAQGVTAAFNLNLLARINRELGGEFDLRQFQHRAFYDAREGRIEMHLVSDRDQTVRIGALELCASFARGETIHTENSYKFTGEQIDRLARESGFSIERHWTDEREWFSVVLLAPR